MEGRSPHYFPKQKQTAKKGKKSSHKHEKENVDTLMSCFNSVKTEAIVMFVFSLMTDGGDSSHCTVKGGIGSGATGFDDLHLFAEVIFREKKVRIRSIQAHCQLQN